MYKDPNQVAYLQELNSGRLDTFRNQFVAYNRGTRLHVSPTKGSLKIELADLIRKEELIGLDGKILLQQVGGTESEIIEISDLTK